MMKQVANINNICEKKTKTFDEGAIQIVAFSSNLTPDPSPKERGVETDNYPSLPNEPPSPSVKIWNVKKEVLYFFVE